MSSVANALPEPIPHTDHRRWSGLIAGGFVALLGFLLASFPARNPDVWQHLAAGRDLIRGRAPASSDPAAAPAWLFDLASYATFAVGGDTGLVMIKAALIAGLALVLLVHSRTRRGWLIPSICTGLAVLAMGMRLFLQPATVSYLFLALALWFLRSRDRTDDRCWPLLAWKRVLPILFFLFIVWANTDHWFVVGLATVALLGLGRALDLPAGARLRATGRWAAVIAILAAACLLNPWHIAVFGLSPALTAGGLSGAASPFQRVYLKSIGESPAGLAYFPLIGLGLLSFALTARAWRWERFLPWVGLAALSALQVQAVPFFAVVGGPILAWNLQDLFSRRAAGTGRRSRRGRLAVAGPVGVFGLAFLACAWPGWLQRPPFGTRRWAVETPPALQHGAEVVCRWQAESRLGPEPRGLHLSPDTIAAFAWFCPDHRLAAGPALSTRARETDDPGDLAERMRAAGANHVVVYDPDPRRLAALLGQLLADPDQWPLLYLEGGLTVFGWRDPARPADHEAFRSVEWDLNQRAVWPDPSEKAPPARSTREPDPRRWWEAFWRRAPFAPDDRRAASVYIMKAEALRHSAPDRHLAAWEAAWVAGAAAYPIGGLGLAYQVEFARNRGDIPIGVLYLAVRAARRAVAANPFDAQAYVLLGDAYLRLIQFSRERAWGRSLSELVQVRRAQAAAAFTQAIAIDPGLAEAHLKLGAMFWEMGFFDLAVRHQREYLAALRGAAPPEGRLPAYRVEVTEAEDQLDRFATAVDEMDRAFVRESAGLRVLDRATLARDRGLAGKALDILLGSDISAFGTTGMALELELLIRVGRPKEVRDWTAAEHEPALGPMYNWLRAQAFAASGDYALAEEECKRLAAGTESETASPRDLVAVLIGQTVLDACRHPDHRGGPVWEAFRQADLGTRLRRLVADIRRAADSLTLRGLLALEEGETEAAAQDFRRALATWVSDSAAADGRGIEFLGRVAAQEALAWIESVPRQGGMNPADPPR